ncbi:MAG: DciA family protein [Endomicrobium sp.]|nr:DciA family protein [Endomicrobium sp.]
MSWTQAEEIISLLKKKLGLDEDFFVIRKIWEKEIGINGVEISGYKDGTILAQTQSSAANFELTTRKKEIIRKLNQYIGSSKIKNIKVKIK